MTPPPDDKDRAAILARRKYFVATALAGIAVAACPQPCLGIVEPVGGDAARSPPPARDVDAATAEDLDAGTTSPFQACLNVAPPTPAPPPTAPRPCLDVSAPPTGMDAAAPPTLDAGQPTVCLNVSMVRDR